MARIMTSRRKTALITGITGQDGAYLTELLLGKGYDVHGLVRWDAADGTARLQELGVAEDIRLHHGDLTDASNVTTIIKEIQPDEIYNLGALSHVHVSFETPASVLDINTKGTLNILDAVRILEMNNVRIYQASSSEMFGSAPAPQNEKTPFEPCSPYGVAKLAAYWLARTYRDSYGIHVSNGILFNHESPLRGQDFVTQKIVQGVVAIALGQQAFLTLGNLNSMRDWGHARDYVRGMWMMLQQDRPGDYVLATGQARSVREFVEAAFKLAGISIEWRGDGVDEIGIGTKSGKTLVHIDSSLFRPKEVPHLLGDPSKARNVLGWQPEVGFEDLILDMILAERVRLGLKVSRERKIA
jgi:GDPmannose 4,6-dehydratase